MKKYKHKITGDIVSECSLLTKNKRMYSNGTYDVPACFVENGNDWEEILDTELKPGTWICFPKITRLNKTSTNEVSRILEILEDNYCGGKGWINHHRKDIGGGGGFRLDGNGYYLGKDFRLASKEEIESYLISEAKRRGYNNKKVTGLETISGTIIFDQDYKWKQYLYDETSDSLYVGTHESAGGERLVIYRNGNWAEKIEYLKTISGYDVLKTKNGLKIGCQEFNKEDLEAFLRIAPILNKLSLLPELKGYSNLATCNFGLKGFTIGNNNSITIYYTDLEELHKAL